VYLANNDADGRIGRVAIVEPQSEQAKDLNFTLRRVALDSAMGVIQDNLGGNITSVFRLISCQHQKVPPNTKNIGSGTTKESGIFFM
jgi:hypothetical protein